MKRMDSSGGSGNSNIPKLPQIVQKKSTYDHNTPKPSITVEDEDRDLAVSRRQTIVDEEQRRMLEDHIDIAFMHADFLVYKTSNGQNLQALPENRILHPEKMFNIIQELSQRQRCELIIKNQ